MVGSPERFFFDTTVSIVNSVIVVASAAVDLLLWLALHTQLDVDLLLGDGYNLSGLVILVWCTLVHTHSALLLLDHVQRVVLVRDIVSVVATLLLIVVLLLLLVIQLFHSLNSGR